VIAIAAASTASPRGNRKMNAIANIALPREALWFGNTLVSIVIPSETGADGMSVIEHWMPYGDSPPLHVHRNEDEIFHLISGSLCFAVGDKTGTVHAGETLLAPKGVPHSYRVESFEGAHCLTVTRGKDFETMVRAAGRKAERFDLPDLAVPTKQMIEGLTRLCEENGISIVGAPLS
jgi:quercetin dioxygenase-like cupin family protein